MPDGRPDIRALLGECVDSFEQLELLVLLRRERGAWSAERAAAAIGATEDVAADALRVLAARRLVAAGQGGEPVWRYAPAEPRLDEAAAAIERSYADNRLDVVKWMSENAIARVRDAAARAFADAFLLRKEKKDG
jgi:hypothetical protein